MPIAEAERARRRALIQAHYRAENEHDIERIMKTFSPSAEMLYNRQSFAEPDAIRQAHGYIGFAATAGAFAGIHNVIDGEHFTDDEIVIEGRLCGTHVAEFQGFAPSGRAVELPFVAFYRFDAAGKLVSERVVMNLGVLGASPAWQPAE
jgi:hypothetical protein